MRIVAIIQARMGSSRLPGKVMLDLCGKTVLQHVIERVRTCALIDSTVVATTEHARDDIIVSLSRQLGAGVFRGSEDDVLGRYFLAACQARADIVVRVTSDCPLIDPDLLTAMIGRFVKERNGGVLIDYMSNGMKRTFPRGLDAEVFTFDALKTMALKASKKYEREHVTPYLYQHPHQFQLRDYLNDVDLSSHRWTLDTEEDWQLISRIYANLYRPEETFTTAQVLELLTEKPELSLLNAHIEQKKLTD